MLCTPAQASDVPASELSIGGVASGATEASVIELLGEPSQRLDTGEGVDLRYPGLLITVGWFEHHDDGEPRRVLALFGNGPGACTPRGLCPGMPASQAGRLYGPTTPVQRGSGTFLEFQPEGVSCWLSISVPGPIVESVAVACQP